MPDRRALDVSMALWPKPSKAATIAIAAFAFAMPAPAAAVEVLREGSTLVVRGDETKDFLRVDDVGISEPDAIVVYTTPRASIVSAEGCLDESVPNASQSYIKCKPPDAFARVRVEGRGGGDDFIMVMVTRLAEVDGGAGADEIEMGSNEGPSIVRGGDGGDQISAGAGSDQIDGGAGSDYINFNSAGTDTIAGGSGFDIVAWETSVAIELRMSLDGAANDGRVGATTFHNLGGDLERLVGSVGNDVLIGNGAGNELIGLGGNDMLDGGGGYDRLLAGAGDDELLARDGLAESVQCGDGNDRATLDSVDLPDLCEQPNVSDELEPDHDRDGVDRPADCNDRDPAVHPGAFDTPENGLDENCDGIDAVVLDRDRDGVDRPADCDDGNARIRPGAEDVPGNAVDEDCDGVKEPFPPIDALVALSIQPGKTIRLLALAVTELDGGEIVQLRCRGRGCPRSANARRTVAKDQFVLKLDRLLRRARVRPGTVLEVRVQRSDGVVKIIRITLRRGRRPPLRQTTCITPPAREPRVC